jgi:HSP20 family protein
MNLKSLIPINRDRGVTRMEGHPFSSLQREVDRLFDDFTRGFPAFGFGGTRDLVPSVDVSETDKELLIAAELPGIEEKDVHIDVSGNVLTIRGEKKSESESKDKNYRLIERSYGAFSRRLELPAGVDLDAIKAKMEKGVLTVTVPKPAEAQSKRIEVKGV